MKCDSHFHVFGEGYPYAPDLRFDVFYVTSRNRRGYRDLEHARHLRRV